MLFPGVAQQQTRQVAAWTPADLGAKLQLWLDASDLGTITTSGTDVTAWNDKSGNANHMSPDTVSYPQYQSDSTLHAGYPGIVTDGASEMGTTGTMTYTSLITVIGFETGLTDSFDSWETLAMEGTGGGNRIQGQQNAVPNNQWYLLGWAIDTNYMSYVNGSTSPTAVGLPMPASIQRFNRSEVTSTLAILFQEGQLTRGWRGTVYEMIISNAPTAGEITNLESYLSTKWGITLV